MMSASAAAGHCHSHGHAGHVHGPNCNHSHGPSTENKSNNMISSDKPYVCDICGRGYSYLASLEQHKVRNCYSYNFGPPITSDIIKNRKLNQTVPKVKECSLVLKLECVLINSSTDSIISNREY